MCSEDNRQKVRREAIDRMRKKRKTDRTSQTHKGERM